MVKEQQPKPNKEGKVAPEKSKKFNTINNFGDLEKLVGKTNKPKNEKPTKLTKPEKKPKKIEQELSKEEIDTLLKRYTALRSKVRKYAEKLKNAKNRKARKNLSYHNRELMGEYKRIGKRLDELGLLPKSDSIVSPKKVTLGKGERAYFDRFKEGLDALIDSLSEEEVETTDERGYKDKKGGKAKQEGYENKESGPKNTAEQVVEAVDNAAKKAEGAKVDLNGPEAGDLEKIHESGLLNLNEGKRLDAEIKILEERVQWLDEGIHHADRVLEIIAKIKKAQKEAEKKEQEEKQEQEQGDKQDGDDTSLIIDKPERPTVIIEKSQAVASVERMLNADYSKESFDRVEKEIINGRFTESERELLKTALLDLKTKYHKEAEQSEKPKDIELKENLKVDYFSIPRSNGSFPLKFRRETVNYEVYYKISSSNSQLGKIEYISDKIHDRRAINEFKAFLEPVAIVEGEEKRDNACCIKMIEPGEMRKSGEEWVVVKKMRVRFLEHEGVDEEEAYDKVLLKEYQGKIETSYSLNKDGTRKTELNNAHYVFQLRDTSIFEYHGEREFKSIFRTRDGAWEITTLDGETIFVKANGEIVESEKEKNNKEQDSRSPAETKEHVWIRNNQQARVYIEEILNGDYSKEGYNKVEKKIKEGRFNDAEYRYLKNTLDEIQQEHTKNQKETPSEKNENIKNFIENLKNTLLEFDAASKTMLHALHARQEQGLSPLQTPDDFQHMLRLIQKLSKRESLHEQDISEVTNDMNALAQLFEEMQLHPARRGVRESIDNLEQLAFGAKAFANFCEESQRKLVIEGEDDETQEKIAVLRKAFNKLSEQAGRLALLSAKLRESLR